MSKFDVNLAEKLYGKMKAQGEETVADFIYKMTNAYKELEQFKFHFKELAEAKGFDSITDVFVSHTKLKQQLTKSQAHNERLRSGYQKMVDWNEKGYPIAVEMLAETQNQSLALHDADVIERQIKEHMIVADGREVCIVNEMESDVYDLRNSVKEGE